MPTTIIIGGGQAGGQAAARLKPEGYAGEIVLFAAEPQLPYQRPPLSKAYLAGEIGLERVLLRPAEAYDKAGVTVRSGTAVETLDTAAREAVLAGGERVAYDNAVIATGANVRRLDLPGADLGGIHYLRSIADADAIRAAVQAGTRLAVVGGGYIGLEVAAVAARAGATVTVLEAESQLMARVCGGEIAAHFLALHQREGVTVRFGARACGFAGEGGTVDAVTLADGDSVACDAVVVGVGVVPETSLAEAAGIAVDDGITVDAECRTSAEGVYAAGDCTRHPSGLYGGTLRLESVHNAMTQARVVAANIAGKAMRYDEVPWFWSDQYDAKLQMAGIAHGADRHVVRGAPESGKFSVIHLRDGQVIAGESVSAMQDHMALRALITARATPDEAALADESVPLKSLA